jgi:hypothetical protein
MCVIKKTKDNKCWQGCGEKQTLAHCWMECKLVVIKETSMEVSQAIKIRTFILFTYLSYY